MGRLRVLYVDDEEDIRTIVEMALALDTTIECRTAGSAAAALSLLAGWQPDIAVLDLMMPVTGGRELLAALRGNPATAGLPVALATAGTADGAVLEGVCGVITKPFDPLSLAARIRALMPSVP
jgi:CheY-like chemotaxis protein